jgi:histidyl-tRNA synthetase
MTNDHKRLNKLSTEPYKGVRDFYPEDQRVQNYIFGKMREVAESFGYSEYNASVLEPAELYEVKSGEEIVNEQMYVFEDRGGRRVALRPEMTPTLARMVAARRRELSLPLRWYTIANMFRYERPQRGRLREHWQLNCDLIGPNGPAADAEIITIAWKLLMSLGLKEEHVGIRVSHRGIFADILDKVGLPAEKQAVVRNLIDRKDKISKGEFEEGMIEAAGGEDISKKLLSRLHEKEGKSELLALTPIKALYDLLSASGINNTAITYDLWLMRGFDYYTGMVFEVFDKHPDNNRALFGGGRYDNLLEIFGSEKIPAVGFGMGDVAIRNTLETYRLLPENLQMSSIQLYICVLAEQFAGHATALGQNLRDKNIKVAVDYSGRKIADQVKKANKDAVPYILFVGEEEIKIGKYRVKRMTDGQERTLAENEIKILFRPKYD